jgi:two-component system, sensor histidine kinase PdtaS
MIRLAFRFNFLFLFLFLLSFNITAQINNDSLLRLIQVADDTTKVNSLNSLAERLKSNNLDSAIFYTENAIFILNNSNGKKTYPEERRKLILASTYQKLGGYYDESDPGMALKYLQKSLHLYESISYEKGIASSLGAIGLVYMNKGDFPKALEYYFKSLHKEEALKNKAGILIKLGNIGIVYDELEEYNKAMEYYTRALKLAEELNDKEHISTQLGNIGILYSKKEEYDTARDYFNRALKIEESLKNTDGISRSYVNIGITYENQGDVKMALSYMLKSLELAKKLGNKIYMASIYANIGVEYSRLKNYRLAEQNLSDGLTIARELRNNDLIMAIEEMASQMYTDSGNDKKALEHYKSFTAARDSIFNAENTRKNVSAELNFEFEKKEAATKAENDKIIYSLEAENKIQKQWRLFLVTISGMALILLYFAKRAYNSKKRLAGLLALEDSRKETLLQEVHHRISNNLQIISSLLSLQSNDAKDERLQEYLNQSQNHIKSLSVLHEMLYQNDSDLQISIEDYIDKILDFHRQMVSGRSSKIVFESRVDPAMFLAKLAVPLALIVNELVTNSLKYAFEEGREGLVKVTLQSLNENHTRWMLSVSDNGKGMPEEDGRRKNSLGLRLVNIMVRQLNATVNTRNEGGTIVEIEFSSLE